MSHRAPELEGQLWVDHASSFRRAQMAASGAKASSDPPSGKFRSPQAGSANLERRPSGDLTAAELRIAQIIDGAARGALEPHAQRMMREGRLLYQCSLPSGSLRRRSSYP